jgi:hypothetical protein
MEQKVKQLITVAQLADMTPDEIRSAADELSKAAAKSKAASAGQAMAVEQRPAEQVEAIGQSEPSGATEEAPLAKALREADEAFGDRIGSRESRLAYSERSGLLG